MKGGVIWFSVEHIDLFVFCGVNRFVGHSPSRSAEVVAAVHIGSVAAEAPLKLGFKIDLRSACC